MRSSPADLFGRGSGLVEGGRSLRVAFEPSKAHASVHPPDHLPMSISAYLYFYLLFFSPSLPPPPSLSACLCLPGDQEYKGSARLPLSTVCGAVPSFMIMNKPSATVSKPSIKCFVKKQRHVNLRKFNHTSVTVIQLHIRIFLEETSILSISSPWANFINLHFFFFFTEN